ncbi:MAG: M48 family metalloprotease [Acidobacteriia bacterium]|nr:M48 family metalloprotease [Terriglobia bacterium]
MGEESYGSFRVVSTLLFCLLPILAAAQQGSAALDVPDKFNLDMRTAARLRPELLAQSTAPGRYATGRRVFEKLAEQAHASRNRKPAWELRIVNEVLLNAFSSPDGTIYVGRGLADLAGTRAGLWAAILSHEIAHVVRRDWARRYLYEESLRYGGGSVVLGDPGLSPVAWTDSQKASEDLARFCRQLELEADLEGLMLMARTGYHPDFVPALHHLLHAQGAGKIAPSVFAMHPCWEERDRELDRAYIVASIEFERRWPEWYASPGGDPPILVFADEPRVKKTRTKEWEIRLPMRCQNLVGAVEVVLQTYSAAAPRSITEQGTSRGAASNDEVRQLTGCTSPKTTITFTVTDDSQKAMSAEVFVLDGQGAVLSRAAIPKLRP